MHRRTLLLALFVLTAPASAQAPSNADGWAALRQGGIVLFRHATAPGGGDPPGMRVGDCTTQRNLDATGQAEAARIGAAFHAQGVTVGRVLASAWCRTTETAEIAFPGRLEVEPAFNSFFADRRSGPAQTEAARAILLGWAGPGALVVSTHQVNITALTGIFPGSGDGIVLRARDGALQVVALIRPSDLRP